MSAPNNLVLTAAPHHDVLMPTLHADVLTIILEHHFQPKVYPGDRLAGWYSFLGLRLLSKQLNDLVIPIAYRNLNLTAGILECFKRYLQVQNQTPFDPSRYPHTLKTVRDQLKVAEYVRLYTQHFSYLFPPDLSYFGVVPEWLWVLDVLNSLQNLRQITWRYWGSSRYVDPSIQYAVLACPSFRARWPQLRISVEGFYDEAALPFHPLFVDLVSCTDIRWKKNTSSIDVVQIKNMLLASPKMETFDLSLYKTEGMVVDWDIKDGEKLPPFKDLKLCGIDWDFSPVEAVGFWDWSKIRHLKMLRVPIIPFLQTVAPESLKGLRTFKTDCWGAGNRVEEASKLLCKLVERISRIETLKIKCNFKSHFSQCFPAIIKHGPVLRSLSLCDFHVSEGDLDLHTVLSIQQLVALRSACPNLAKVEIDINLALEDLGKTETALTTTLASFRSLRKLSLHFWLPHPTSRDELNDIIQPYAVEWIRSLVDMKEGVVFDYLRLYLEVRGVVGRYEYSSFPQNYWGDEERPSQGAIYVWCYDLLAYVV